MPVIWGAGTVKETPLLATPPSVTIMLPLMVLGTVATICVALQLVTVAALPFIVTVLVPCEDPNPLPLMVTDEPTAPLFGERLVITGLYIVKIWSVLLPTLLTVAATGPVVAPWGAVTTICALLQLTTLPGRLLNVT
jgi:hypothetical protein